MCKAAMLIDPNGGVRVVHFVGTLSVRAMAMCSCVFNSVNQIDMVKDRWGIAKPENVVSGPVASERILGFFQE